MELASDCPFLNSNLLDIRANICYRNWDWLDINTGMEGAGKSSLGLYKCCVIDDKFDPTYQTIYSQQQFSDRIDTLSKGQAIYIDEGVEWLFNRNWNTPESRATVADLMVMRELNLFVCVNITNIRYLDVYIREDRLRSMSHIVTFATEEVIDGRITAIRERGIFDCFSRAAILDHFDPDRQYALIPDFTEPFPDISYLDPSLWEEYRKNKREFLKNRKKVREEAKKDMNERTRGEKQYARFQRNKEAATAATAREVGSVPSSF